MTLRVGTGFDAHRLVAGRPLVLGGVTIAHELGLEGHSDADIVCHALIDALLGASALGDIGDLFPPNDPRFAGAASSELLGLAWAEIASAGYELVNCDAVLIAQAPRIAPHRPLMRRRIAAVLGCDLDQVSVRATGTDGLGFMGRGEGMACQAVALLSRP
ncbi:MAG TPA: 2-C-methyl-D-erythritol 2,4-cyclodiphosphate synthase [Gaiellales bacterium]|jgi:2-C-methyl-D-erythritol 2,4-cyclodiphosphate synthase